MTFNFPKLSPPSLPGMHQIATGASNLLSRAVQYTEEKLGNAQKTEFDVDYESVNVVYEKTKKCAEKLKSQTEVTLQPNPSARIEDFVYSKLDRTPPERPSNYQNLGSAMIEAGHDIGSSTTYGGVLLKCGETEMQLGYSENLYFHKAMEDFLQPLDNFLEGDCKTIQKEKKILERKRLDLDACKSRVKKAKSHDSRSEAENDLRVAQTEFDRQQEVTRLLLEGICKNQAQHVQGLTKFIEAQTEYFSTCHEHLKELTILLKSVEPYVLSHPSSSQATVPRSFESSKQRRARVLYDYDAANDAELSLLADEVVTLDEDPKSGQCWVMGRRGEEHGRIPINYITFID